MRVAAEQLSKRELNGFGDGPGRNNKQFALFLPCYLTLFSFPSSFSPLFSFPNPVRYKTNATAVRNVLVLALLSASSYSLQSLQSLDTCHTHKVQGFSSVRPWLSTMVHFSDACIPVLTYLCA